MFPMSLPNASISERPWEEKVPVSRMKQVQDIIRWKKEPSVWEKARGRPAVVKVMKRWALQGRNVG